MSRKPYVSLAVIAGDEALLPADTGEAVLVRMLRSVLIRPGGPMVDEIVIGWNGKDREKIDALVFSFKADDVEFKIVPFAWDGNFARARQLTFEAASGEWIGYFDSDDVIPSPGHPAIKESLGYEGVALDSGPGSPSTENSIGFKDWLRSLTRSNLVYLPYHYVIDNQSGRCIQRTWHARFCRWADGFAWSENVHEDLIPIGGNDLRFVFNAALPVLHYPVVDVATRVRRNIQILEKMEAQAQGQVDFRLLYGLGAGYSDIGQHRRSEPFLQRAVDCAASTVDRLMSLLLLAQVRAELKNFSGALQAALYAVEAAPQQPQGYFMLAEVFYQLGDWSKCIHWFEQGTKCDLGGKNLFMIDQPLTRLVWPKIFAANAYFQIGDANSAAMLARQALSIRPDPAAYQILAQAEERLNQSKVIESVATLVSHLVATDETGAAEMFLHDCLPLDMQEQPGIKHLINQLPQATRAVPIVVDYDFATAELKSSGCERFRVYDAVTKLMLDEDVGTASELAVAIPSRQPGAKPGSYRMDARRLLTWCSQLGLTPIQLYEKKDRHGATWVFAILLDTSEEPARRSVTFFCPQYAEPWGPDTPRQVGCGSSEEAVVYLAEELVKHGWSPEVFAPLNDTSVFVRNRVRWRHLREFDHRDAREILVAHRAPWVAKQPDVGAQRLILWHQDAWYPSQIWGPAVIRRSEQVFVSDWHRQKLMSEGKITQARGRIFPNAVPDQHLGNGKSTGEDQFRDPHLAVWASNPSRGLMKLLKIWPEIRAAVPDARLHIYYGWEVVLALAVSGHHDLFHLKTVIEQEIENLKDYGVEWKGRVGQDELTRVLRGAGVMPYSCVGFEEGYCAALTRALAAGCIPVFTNTGALAETQPERKYMISKPWDEGGWSEFISATIAAMNDTEFDREAGAKLVPHWSDTATLWHGYLKSPTASDDLSLETTKAETAA